MLGSWSSSRCSSPVQLTLISVAVAMVAGLFGCSSNGPAGRSRDDERTGAASSAPGGTRQALTPEQITQLNRGVALLGRYRYDAAAEVFAALAQQAPWFIPAQLNLAIAQLNEDQSGSAPRVC